MQDMQEKIEKELNALINEAAERGGFVHIVDKKQNNFVLRLSEDVRIISFIPTRAEGAANES